MNSQKIEPMSHDATLEVHSIWHTIQGEGMFAGVPAFFIRLAGCNLQCPLCDTDYTSQRQRMTVLQIQNALAELQHFHRQTSLVVLTGGEVYRQGATHELIARLLPYFNVQVETNGLSFFKTPTQHSTLMLTASEVHEELYRLMGDRSGKMNSLYVVCSPKVSRLDITLLEVLHTAPKGTTALKYVVENGWTDKRGLPTRVLGRNMRVASPPENYPINQIYIQPLDTGDPIENQLHIQTAVESCLRHGYRLCLQTHKIAGLP